MQRIVPNLWFDHKAAEAADYYSGVFPDTQVVETVHHPTDGLLDFQKEFAGDVLTVAFEIRGYRFMGINAGPDVTLNPSISFMVNVPPEERATLDAAWGSLVEGGEVSADQTELDRYWEQLSKVPEAEQCGWCADQFGVSWQLVPEDLGGLMAKPGAYEKLMTMKKIEVAAFG